MNKNPNLYDILEYLTANGKEETNRKLLEMYANAAVTTFVMQKYLAITQFSKVGMIVRLTGVSED